MAGDYFETPTQLEQVAKLGTFGKQQIDLVRWKVNGSSGPKPAVGPGVEEAVNTRYEDLASRNQTHFSTGSSPGNSNKERYIDLHTQAIQAGFQAGAFATGFPQFPAHIPGSTGGICRALPHRRLLPRATSGLRAASCKRIGRGSFPTSKPICWNSSPATWPPTFTMWISPPDRWEELCP